MLEKMFKLKENNTTAKTEVIAGITTFMTMAYILAVNPNLLSQAGMDPTAVLIATCLASFIGTFAMALLANYPFALAPGMGLNAYFAFTVCGNMGYSWKVALMAVFFEGIIFIILSLTNVREAIFNAIPTTLKKGVSAGIGLFIAFIGLQGGHIVVNNDSTLLSYVNFRDNWHTEGICAVLALIGLLLTAILYIKKVKGSILIGILATWILGMICQAAGVYRIDADAGFYSLYPTFAMTTREAPMLVFVFTSVILLFISGVSWPKEAIPPFWQAIGYLFPSTPGIQGFIRINTCGAALNEVVHEYHTLWIQAGVYFVLALVIYRFQIIRSRKMIIKQHRYMKMKQTF